MFDPFFSTLGQYFKKHYESISSKFPHENFSYLSNKRYPNKVCQHKKQTDIFLNNTKVIAPTFKTQARGLNNLFRALK